MATNQVFLDGDTMPIVAPAAMTSGLPRKIGDALIVIPIADIDSGATGTVFHRGIFNFPKTGSGGIVFALGDRVYWNQGTAKATATVTDDLIGVAVAAATDAATVVRVAFNGHLDSDGGLLNNYAGAVGPAVTDDANDGYSVGSVWIDIVGDASYICVDPAVGAAVWNPTDATAVGAVLTDDYTPAQTVLVAVADKTPLPVVMGASTILGRLAAGNLKACTAAEVATLVGVDGCVKNATFDAQSTLVAVADDTPAAVTFAASTFLGRLAAGNLKACTAAEVATNIGVDACIKDADYTPAQSILGAITDVTPVAITFAASRFLGRLAAGDLKACTVAEVLTELNVESGADVTDAGNVDTAAQGLIAPEHCAVLATSALQTIGVPFLVEYNVEGAAGSIDVEPNFPYKVKVLKVEAYCSAANAGGTARLFKGTVGVPGNAITDAITMAVEGVTTSAALVHAEITIQAAGTLHVVKNAAGDDGFVRLTVVRIP